MVEVEENKKLFFARNIFAFYGAVLMILFLKYNLDGYVQDYNFLQKLIMVLVPLMTGSLFWNWKLYNYLNKAAYTDDRSFLKTYLNMTIFLMVVVFLFDIAMTYGIYLKLFSDP